MTHYRPDGVSSVTIYLNVADADQAMTWYEENMGATILSRLAMPDGSVMHAEIELEGSRIMITDANPEWGTTAPGELATYTLCVYVPDSDALFDRCLAGGASSLEPVTDQVWGDRTGKIRDPFGVRWMIMTHVEDVSDAEVEARFAAMMEGN